MYQEHRPEVHDMQYMKRQAWILVLVIGIMTLVAVSARGMERTHAQAGRVAPRVTATPTKVRKVGFFSEFTSEDGSPSAELDRSPLLHNALDVWETNGADQYVLLPDGKYYRWTGGLSRDMTDGPENPKYIVTSVGQTSAFVSLDGLIRFRSFGSYDYTDGTTTSGRDVIGISNADQLTMFAGLATVLHYDGKISFFSYGFSDFTGYSALATTINSGLPVIHIAQADEITLFVRSDGSIDALDIVNKRITSSHLPTNDVVQVTIGRWTHPEFVLVARTSQGSVASIRVNLSGEFSNARMENATNIVGFTKQYAEDVGVPLFIRSDGKTSGLWFSCCASSKINK